MRTPADDQESITGGGTTPTISWALPDGFTTDTVRV
jgi:hypothetical protein